MAAYRGDSAGSEPGAGLSRRALLTAAAAGGAGLALAGPLNYAARARAARIPAAGEIDFAHVSAGMPHPESIVLWTRANDGLERSSRLTLEVARDPGFRRLITSRSVTALARDDFTVHAPVRGLDPSTEYFYRFHTPRSHSRVGRFRTLPPPDSRQPIRIGFFSCQAYEAGYFPTHAALATEVDLDVVLCLGDYIYEHLFYRDQDVPGRTDTTGDNGDGEAQRLHEYREKYHLYQADPNLADMHAAHPYIAAIDDHEVEDNWAGESADSAQQDPTLTNQGLPRTVSFARRRANGFRAYFEAHPRLRVKNSDRIYGRVRIGGLVDLLLLDTRSYRDPQPCGDALVVPCLDTNTPGRTILGAEQKAWLKRSLEQSDASWKLLGNQVMMMGFDSAPGVTVNVDGWDGYAAEREEVLNHVLAAGVTNLVSLTGDIHTFFAGTMTTTGSIGGRPAGTEFVGGSITSSGVPETLGLPPQAPNDTIAQVLRVTNPHLVYVNAVRHGYAVATITAEELRCDYKAAKSVRVPNSEVFTLARFRVPAGQPTIERL